MGVVMSEFFWIPLSFANAASSAFVRVGSFAIGAV
jgi:hypothetical protein